MTFSVSSTSSSRQASGGATDGPINPDRCTPPRAAGLSRQSQIPGSEGGEETDLQRRLFHKTGRSAVLERVHGGEPTATENRGEGAVGRAELPQI